MQTIGIVGGIRPESTLDDLDVEVLNTTQIHIDAIIERLAAGEAD